ncbi:MAG: carbohydrate kinase family protein [Solirubrobacteraceae bacterium]
MSATLPSASRNVLCLGQARVDLICERPVAMLTQADAFVPHFGGAVANVAMMSARAGARIALAGAVGDDEWGRWLYHQLARAGVDLGRFRLVEDMETPISLTTVGSGGEPAARLHGAASSLLAGASTADVELAVQDAGGLFISSCTLADSGDRAITMRARELALERRYPVVFDANREAGGWSADGDGAGAANACVPGALLVHVNAQEAHLLTGERDLEQAARVLLENGAHNVVVTAGDQPAILRGELRMDVPAAAARVISTLGAGDALMAALLARLQTTGFYVPAIAASLREAMVVAARACERWGACD